MEFLEKNTQAIDDPWTRCIDMRRHTKLAWQRQQMKQTAFDGWEHYLSKSRLNQTTFWFIVRHVQKTRRRR